MSPLKSHSAAKRTARSEALAEQKRGVSAERQYIHNETPKRLILNGDGGSVMILAPLERTEPLKARALERFNLEPLKEQNLLRIVPFKSKCRLDAGAYALLGSAILLVILVLALSWWPPKSLWHSDSTSSYQGYGLAGLSTAVLLAYPLNRRGLRRSWRQLRIAMGRIRPLQIIHSMTRAMWFIFIGILGIGAPATVIYLFGGCRYLWDWTAPTPLLLGRMLQCLFIAIASLLPAVLYFLYDSQCLSTLRSRFEHAIFRLDPNLSTLTDVRAKYGRQADEVYGPEDKHNGRTPLNIGSHFPILAATLLISMGWLITLVHLEVHKDDELLTLFAPQLDVLVFGFLGAYFFAVTDVLHRYIRRDLKPKAYSSICVRLLIVVILAWVLKEIVSPVLPGGEPKAAMLALVFLVGIVPETGLTYIREALSPKMRSLFRIKNEEVEVDPLTKIDGIDLYDRTRLMDEGVTNIESLAHHDLVDLMIETRIPVPRLIDWLDQAILYLHAKESDGGDDSKLQRQLRKYGIRTATDLLRAYKRAQERGPQQLDALLETLSPSQPGKMNQVQLVVDALSDDEWLDYVQNWRDNTSVREQTIDAQNRKAGSGGGCRRGGMSMLGVAC